jgi:hypothetical protein
MPRFRARRGGFTPPSRVVGQTQGYQISVGPALDFCPALGATRGEKLPPEVKPTALPPDLLKDFLGFRAGGHIFRDSQVQSSGQAPKRQAFS